MKKIAALIAVVGMAAAANAAWGLKFEVSKDGGATWSSSVNAVAGDVVTFRIGAYHDGTDVVTSTIPAPGGTGPTMQFNRFTGSNKVSGKAANDLVSNYGSARPNPDPAGATIRNELKAMSDNGTEAILGTAGNAASFGSRLVLNGARELELYFALVQGQITIGAGGTDRVLSLMNNTFGAGSQAGLTFYFTNDVANSAQPTSARADQTASINVSVIPAPASMALLGLGGLVATRRRR